MLSDAPLDSTNDSDDENFNDNPNFSNHSKCLENSEFVLIISEDLYEKMKPGYYKHKDRERLMLTPNVWTDIVADEFFRQHRLSCAYSFRNATASRNSATKNFIEITGFCKSKICNSKLTAIAEEEPVPGGSLVLKIYTKNTINTQHEQVQRHLRCVKRELIGKEVVAKGALNVVRDFTLKEGKRGDLNQPNVYNLTVLRKLRQKIRDKDLGISPSDDKDPIFYMKL